MLGICALFSKENDILCEELQPLLKISIVLDRIKKVKK